MSHDPSVGLKLKPDLSTPENREYWEWVRKQRKFWEERKEQDEKLRGQYYTLVGVLRRVVDLTEEIYLGDTTYKGMKTLANVQEANQIAREAIGMPTTASRRAQMVGANDD